MKDLCLGECNGAWHKRDADDGPVDTDESTPFFGWRDCVLNWERFCHAVEETLTADFPNFSKDFEDLCTLTADAEDFADDFAALW